MLYLDRLKRLALSHKLTTSGLRKAGLVKLLSIQEGLVIPDTKAGASPSTGWIAILCCNLNLYKPWDAHLLKIGPGSFALAQHSRPEPLPARRASKSNMCPSRGLESPDRPRWPCPQLGCRQNARHDCAKFETACALCLFTCRCLRKPCVCARFCMHDNHFHYCSAEGLYSGGKSQSEGQGGCIFCFSISCSPVLHMGSAHHHGTSFACSWGLGFML